MNKLLVVIIYLLSLSNLVLAGNSYLIRGQAWLASGSPDKACLDWRKALELGEKEASNFIKKNCK